MSLFHSLDWELLDGKIMSYSFVYLRCFFSTNPGIYMLIKYVEINS